MGPEDPFGLWGGEMGRVGDLLGGTMPSRHLRGLCMGSGSLLPGFPWPSRSNSRLLMVLQHWGGPGQAAGGALSCPQCSSKSRTTPPSLLWLRGKHGVTGLLASCCEHCRDGGGDAPASIHL